ncbi:alpha/beta hydrolase [Edaphobacillus lindanitolerans]|uniref:Enterochelin esterase n=1 Tax=Edaphobacillus lindanitolerans TaxID=550447 RepID=A0A1U7PLZ4_9BACI|nr:alpha/beta hydrolase-fold protein [Edaphobacillus lindanitolerans]SIT68617.1 Enterochelin esterase [Edaphobacillus lindanitolerans]
MKNGRINELNLYSSSLGEDMELLVYLPEDYSPLYKYSVLIASDGKDYFQYGRLSRLLERLRKEQAIDRTIVVGIPYKSVGERRRMYHPDGDRNADYIRFLAHELVPYIDEKFPTYQMGAGRVLIGDSLAATVSLMTACKYPNIFGTAVCQSPYVDSTVMAAVEGVTDPYCLDIYQVIGTGETEVKTTSDGIRDFLAPNRELRNLIEKKGFSSFYEEFNGEHTWKYWQQDLERAIRFALGD